VNPFIDIRPSNGNDRRRRMMHMKAWAVALILAAHSVHASPPSDLNAKVWNHGAEDCRANRDPAIEVFRYDAATYILRQNKCVHFEAPFIYVLFGSHTVFVQDTGAVADPERSPLYQTVRDLISQRPAPAPPLRLLVTHSHSHGDHTAGDSQFRGKLDVTLVEPDARSVREHFGFARWPEGIATIDLGGRELLVLPIPGHQAESIAVYDSHTRWLLTGDTLYPGELIVRERLGSLSVEHRSPGGVLTNSRSLGRDGHPHRDVPHARAAVSEGKSVPARRSRPGADRERSDELGRTLARGRRNTQAADDGAPRGDAPRHAPALSGRRPEVDRRSVIAALRTDRIARTPCPR
jgi:glyoxylase-like metal-dependent hydrolase (beta-lactamase superfamily II)